MLLTSSLSMMNTRLFSTARWLSTPICMAAPVGLIGRACRLPARRASQVARFTPITY
jgi:hypothetical protein